MHNLHTYIYVYIYIERERYTYIHTCIHTYKLDITSITNVYMQYTAHVYSMCIYIYIYIYTYAYKDYI